MKRSFTTIVLVALSALILAVSSPVSATSISLIPNALNVTPGSTVDISVYMDGSSPITMTAISTDIVYDKNVFTYDGLSGVTQGALLTHTWDLSGAQTTTLRVGGIDLAWGENISPPGTLFTFTLKVNPAASFGSYELAWGDAGNGVVGFDYGDADFNDVILPSFGASINVRNTAVPEPMTMLLLGLGLMGVAGAGRKFKK